MSHGTGRPLRADAQENRDRVLNAAAKAFARDGRGASLKAIAQDAGFGIGTLYRRIPSRERLVEATYRSDVTRTCAPASELLNSPPPAGRLCIWMDCVLDSLRTK